MQVNSAATHIVSFTDNIRKAGNAQILEKAFSGAGLKRVRFASTPKLSKKKYAQEIIRNNRTAETILKADFNLHAVSLAPSMLLATRRLGMSRN